LKNKIVDRIVVFPAKALCCAGYSGCGSIGKIEATRTVADRQLKVYEATNSDLNALVDYMAPEAAGDYLRPDV
jgi:hypothetical protein